MSKDLFRVTYTGDGVVRLGSAGVFQQGTAACVGPEMAAEARAQGQFKVEPMAAGGEAAPVEKPAAPAAPKPEVKAEAKPEARPEPKAEAKSEASKPASKPSEPAKPAEQKTEGAKHDAPAPADAPKHG